MRYHSALPMLAAAALAACRDSAPTGPRVAEPLAMTSGATALAAVTPTTVSATSCATISGASSNWRELKAPATSGTYTDGNITVTLTMNGRYFGWSATSTRTSSPSSTRTC